MTSALYQLTTVDPHTGLVEPVSASRRVEALLAVPNARQVIRALDPQTVYGLVSAAGMHDAHDLIVQLTPAQCVALVDFDCWTRDDVAIDRVTTWLDAFLQFDDDAFAETLAALDPEPLVLWIRESTRVLLWEEDREYIDTLDDPILTSPDGQYAIVLTDEDEDTAGRLRHFLERVYAIDLVEGHRFLEAARWELSSDMQEHAFQRRTARLGDLGFLPVHEAIEVYAPIDHVAWAARARARALDVTTPWTTLSASGALPPVDDHLQALEARGASNAPPFFHQALARLTEVVESTALSTVVDSVMAQFRAVANRVHIADLGQPGDVVASRQAVQRTIDSLSLGLEFAAQGDPVLGARILAKLPLREVHQAGYATTVRLAQQAKRLRDRGNLTLIEDTPESLLREADQALFNGLLQRRPVLDADRQLRFSRLAEIEDAALRLGDVAFMELLIYGWMRMTRAELSELVYDARRCASPVELLSFRSVLATLGLRALLELPVALEPLTLPQVHEAQKRLARSADPAGLLLDTLGDLFELRRRGDGSTAPLEQRVATDVAGWLSAETSGQWGTPLVAEVAAQLVILAP